MGKFFFENINGTVIGKTDDDVLNNALCYGFSTRIGGVSDGSLYSLNLGVNRPDTPENLKQNYKIFCDALGIDPQAIIVPRQVHSDTIFAVSRQNSDIMLFSGGCKPECDGLVTIDCEVALGIFYADCTPVLLFDPTKKCLAVVHCGWRGTVCGFAQKAVLKMCEKFGADFQNIHGVIGPCIGAQCFEVGGEVAEEFVKKGLEAFVKPSKTRSDKFFVDLKGANLEFLLKAGLDRNNITVSDECTHCLNEKYFSHRGCGADTGRMAVIAKIKQEI